MDKNNPPATNRVKSSFYKVIVGIQLEFGNALFVQQIKNQHWQCCRGVATDFWVGGGRIVGRVANLPQNTLKIGKIPDFGHFILESGGVDPPGFQKCGGRDPRPPPPSATPLQCWLRAEREAHNEFFCGLTRALEGGLRITPSGGGGAYNAPHRSQLLWELTRQIFGAI